MGHEPAEMTLLVNLHPKLSFENYYFQFQKKKKRQNVTGRPRDCSRRMPTGIIEGYAHSTPVEERKEQGGRVGRFRLQCSLNSFDQMNEKVHQPKSLIRGTSTVPGKGLS